MDDVATVLRSRHVLARLFRIAREHSDILTNASSLVGSNAITSLLGFVYWAAAARAFPAEAVGFASASVSTMALLAKAGQLGLGTLLMGELPRRPSERHALLSASLAAAFVLAFALGLGFAYAAPLLSGSLALLSQEPLTAILFAIGTGFTGAMLVLDSGMIGLLRGDLQLWRNGIFALAKLVLLLAAGVWVTGRGGTTIVLTWIAGLIVSLLAFARPDVLRAILGGDIVPRLRTVASLSGLAVRHHALNMAMAAPSLALPLVVTVSLSASVNAYFYTAWMMASLMFIGLFSLTATLYASGSGRPEEMWRRLRLTLALAFGAGLAGNLLFYLAGDRLLGVYGADYAVQAEPVLRIVGLGVFTLAFREHYVTIRRIRGELGSTALVTAGGGAIELALAAIGASQGGLVGLCVGWLLGTCVEAVYMSRTVILAAFPDGIPGSLWGARR